MIVSNPFNDGKFTMKSMDTFSHGLLGISDGCNNPTFFLLNVQFSWQIKQVSRIPLHRLSNSANIRFY
jgi:hypothetical protein